MTKPESNDLLFCPFCGSEDVFATLIGPSCRIECNNCACRGPWQNKASKELATELWNKRAK
jgi:Lar family restriction alleviation protein